MPGEVFPPAAQGLRGETILIVEDDTDIGEFLQQLIEEETPYTSAIISNGLQALEKASYILPCLLLLYYSLPVIRGKKLYDSWKDRQETNGKPAIMMSATLPVDE